MKKVSIIMPCYNDGKYIKESILSALSQSYPDKELIIIDDGSTDKYTIDILDNINDKRIMVIKSENKKPAAARNLGIKNASGEYILPLDADDLIDKYYLEKAVKILEENSNIGVVYCYADLFGEIKGRWHLPDYSIEKMLLDNIVFVTSMFRKSDWEKVGGFNESMLHGMEDYDFWLSILELNREIYQIPEILFHYRIKKISRTKEFMGNCSNMKKTYELIYNNHPFLYNKYKDKYAILLRDALIEHIFILNEIKKKVKIIDRLSTIPMIKHFIKKYMI